jgi:predicted Zn-dependent protease
VADVLANLAWFGFNGKAFAERQSFAELGTAQFDRAVTLVDEPLGHGGEPAPGLPFDMEGTPRSAVTLVRAGTTAAVAHDRRSAAEAGASSTGHASPWSRTWGPMATHLRLEPSGTAPAALITAMGRGLLITDFWYTRVLDQKSLVVTGLTRNGVWLVEDGEVTSAVTNLRFTQSYPHALGPGAVRGIGSTAVALPARWPGGRCTTPALHLASWNVTGNASG